MKKSSMQGLLATLLTICFGISAAASDGFAQGGKAEPKRIAFETGKSSVVLSGRLSTGQEMEYVFGAKKGQTVTVRNLNYKLFDGRIFSDESNFSTELRRERTVRFSIPQSGDYLFFVSKRPNTKPDSARFSLTLAIK